MINNILYTYIITTIFVSCTTLEKDIRYSGSKPNRLHSINNLKDSAYWEINNFNDETVIVEMSAFKNKVITLGPPYLPIIPYIDFGKGVNSSTASIILTAKTSKLISIAKIQRNEESIFTKDFRIVKDSYFDIKNIVLVNSRNETILLPISNKLVTQHNNKIVTITYFFTTSYKLNKALKWTKLTGIPILDTSLNSLKFAKKSKLFFVTTLHGS